MEWTNRENLTAISHVDNPFGDQDDFKQNILARMALVKGAVKILGGEGIYIGGVHAIGDFLATGTQYPPSTLALNDDSAYTWTFTLPTATPIVFGITSGSAKLYAVILLDNILSPAAAQATITGVYFTAIPYANSAPANSLLLGSGNVSASAFTTWTSNNSAFVSWTTTDRKFTIQGDSGSGYVHNSDIVTFHNGPGINATVEAPSKVVFDVNTYAASGISADPTGIFVKLKPGGGLGVGPSGLRTVNGALYFTIQTNDQVVVPVSGTLPLTITGTAPLSTSATGNNTVHIALALTTNGSFDDSTNTLVVKRGARIAQDNTGLKRTLSSFTISDSLANTQTITEQNTLFVQSNTNHAILTDTTNPNSGEVDVSLALQTNGGLDQSAGDLEVLLKTNGGVLSGVSGLYLPNNSLGATYGPPIANVHYAGEPYRDAGGALWLCTVLGTPGTWMQVNAAISYSVDGSNNPRLPIDSEFATGARLVGYRCRWTSKFFYDQQQRNTFPWIWTSGGYWISEKSFDANFLKVYSDANSYNVSVTYDPAVVQSVVTVNATSATIPAFKKYVFYLGGYYGAFLLENLVIQFKDNTVGNTAKLYYGNCYDDPDATLVSTISISDGVGTATPNFACAYKTGKQHLFVEMVGDFNENDITAIIGQMRYINDVDGVL